MRISDWSSDVCSSDLFLGRGDAGLGNAAQHLEEMTLVATDGVEHGAPAQAFTGQLDDALRHLLQLLAAEAALEREARHVAAELVVLLLRPVLHQLPAGVQGPPLIEQPDPQRRKRDEPPPRPHHGPAPPAKALQP